MKRRDFIRKGAVTGAVASTSHVAGFGGFTEAQAATASGVKYPLVALAGSNDTSLTKPAALDEKLTTEQVRELVWLALDRDNSPRSLTNIVKKDSWAIIKPNLVTCPVTMNDFHAEGIEHWWLVTDLRVVKAVAEYLIERVGPKRISIAEGPPWFTSGGKLKPEKFVDGWHCKWREFGDLSYAEIVEEMNNSQGHTKVDIIDLNEDESAYVEDFDPMKSGIGAFQDVKPGDPDGTSKSEWTKRKGYWYPKSVVDCDVLISVPVLKTHSSAGVTLLFKNLVGCIHSQVYGKGNGKTPVHQGSQLGLIRGVADLGCSLPIHYGIAEGVWATVQQHLGQNGVGINHNVIVAGGDIVATEAVSMMVMGYNPLDYDLLRLMHMKKMGEWNPERISIAGPEVKSLSRNFVRAADTYFARGIRKWTVLGPVKDEVKEPGKLNPNPGDRTDKETWTYFDGDALIDSTINTSKPYKLQECLLMPLPKSDDEKKGRRWYLALRANTSRKDLCGQLLVGVRGGKLRIFFNGRERSYVNETLPYDPTPTPFLKFMEGENVLVLEITKTNDKNEPVLFASNLCDLDGDRLTDITLNPDNERLSLDPWKS